MSQARTRSLWLLAPMGVLAALALAYRLGYQSAYEAGYQYGRRHDDAQLRYLMTVHRDPKQPQTSGASSRLFDLGKPGQAEALRRRVAELEAAGVEHYVTTVTVERTLMPDPDPRHAIDHR